MRFALPVILLIALALRLGWVLRQPAEVDARLGDQFEYLQLGQNLLRSGELKFHDARYDQWIYAYRMPGYPWLIAACGADVRIVRIAQAAIDTSTVFAVFLLARRWLELRAGLIAASLVAVSPYLIYFCGLILSETLFTAMLAWGMYAYVRRPRTRLSVGGGLLILVLSGLVRPSAMALPLLLPGLLDPKPFKQWAVAAALLMLVLFPWAYRNYTHPELKTWVWRTTNEGITRYDGFHDGATGASDQSKFPGQLRLWRLNEIDRDKFLHDLATRWMSANPDDVFWLTLVKIGRTWSPFPLSNDYGGNRLYVLAGLLYTVPLFVLTLLGLWKGDLPRAAKVFLFLPAIYFTTIHALSVGSLRYRIPVEAPMSVIAGSGALVCLSRYGPSRR